MADGERAILYVTVPPGFGPDVENPAGKALCTGALYVRARSTLVLLEVAKPVASSTGLLRSLLSSSLAIL